MKQSNSIIPEGKKRKDRLTSISSLDSPRLGLAHFKKKKFIGAGTASKVYLVEKIDSGRNYAMKVMKKNIKYK